MRHAYLILAHTNWGQLQKLIALLDDNRNDIYLHVDRKSRLDKHIKEGLVSSLRYSNLRFIEPITVNWGGYSIVRAEMQLLRTAIRYEYDYYHLLSGMDLPLKTQDEIDSFFEQNAGHEFLEYDTKGAWIDRIGSRYQYYWLLNEHSRRNNNRLWKKINQLNIWIQRCLHINRLKDHRMAAGPQWFSITHGFASEICANEKQVKKWFRNTFIPDESFVATMAEELGYKSGVFVVPSRSKLSPNLRLIDWNRGKPYVWRMEEYDDLMASECLFARKFDETVDNEIIVKIMRS